MAAPARDVSRSLKEALYETLQSILSPDHNIRTSAEEQIKVLEVTDEFGVHLTELTLDPHAPFAVRQLASVLLRQYVEFHWVANYEKFKPPETTEEAKKAIRHMLPIGLQEPIGKIRSSVAYALSGIAHWDWPEAWPELFDLLMQSLTSENSNAVHGAMRVLTEISRDLSDSQMPHVAPLMLPEMYNIFTKPEKYSIRTRGRAVEIFSNCAETIASMMYYHKGCAKTLLFPLLPQFTEALVAALQVPDGITSDCGLKKEVLNALKNLIKSFPKQMATWLPHILTPVWNSLTQSANLYVKSIVNDIEEADNAVDSDGEVLGFENLVFSIFDFVYSLVDAPKFRNMLKSGMTDLLYYIVLYMQMKEEKIRQWSNNPDQFVEDEDDDTFTYSVRISAQDLLLSLGQEFEDETAVGLCEAVARHLQETDKNSGHPHWWKIHESCMLALGSLKDLIINQIRSNNLRFDILRFLQSVVLEDLNSAASPFLLGRCLWFASKYAVAMSDDLIQRFLQATVSGLQESQPSCVRVSAVRAIWGFCDHLKTTQLIGLLGPYLAPVMEGLLTLATQFSSEVLALVLEAITIVLSVDQNFTASVESRVTPLAIAVFMKHSSDPVLVTLCQEIFSELCHSPACLPLVEQRVLPTLVSILQAPSSKISQGLQAVSLDITQTIVRSSSVPLSEQVVTQLFPAVVFCISHSDDCSVLQNGGECLRAFVSCAMEQISSWHDDMGHSGLDYVVNVTQYLLHPKTPESAAAFVGRLVALLINKAGSALGDNADLLLRAVLSKMQQSEAMSVTQSLVMVFAHLSHTRLEGLLDFLAAVPGPTGRSALEFVLVEWCQCHTFFVGAYENKVSTLALCKLLEHGIKTNDQRLQEIHVKGEQIINPAEGIKTRSKAAQNPDQWTQIPLLIKIYKILIHELCSAAENHIDNRFDDEESSSEGEDIDDDENHIDDDDNRAMAISAAIAECFEADSEDAEDDPDIIGDPVYQVDLKASLTQFLQSLSQLPCYSTFSQHHNSQEVQALRTIGVVS